MTTGNHVVDGVVVQRHTCLRCYGTGKIVPGMVDVKNGEFKGWREMMRCRRAVKLGREIECWSCRGVGKWEVWL